MTRYIAPVLALSLFAAGCMEEQDPISLVNKFRVMAVQADPPEIRPGEGTTLRVLFADPAGDGRTVQILWFACLGEISTADPASAQEESCAPLGFQSGAAEEGFDEFRVPPVPENALDNLAEGEKVLTATAVVVLCAGGELPNELSNPTAMGDSADICKGGDDLTALKTFQISLQNDANRNRNPQIASMAFDEAPLAEATAADGEPGLFACSATEDCLDGATIEATLTEASFQEYEQEQLERVETVDESPYISWFVTGGHLGADRSRAATSDSVFDTTWHPPIDGGVFTLWAVAHDLRGGTSWKQYTIKGITAD